MLGTFSKLKSYVKLRTSVVDITSAVFKLHYRFTFLVLVAFSIMVTSRQYIGEHINCIQDAVSIPPKVLNNYCFISATFSLPTISGSSPLMTTVNQKLKGGVANSKNSALRSGYAGGRVAGPSHELSLFNLGPYTEEDDVVYHAYYQWVPFVLFGQALMFYTPYALWKSWEGNKIHSIIQGLHVFTLKESADQKSKKEEILADYLSRNLHEHNGWALHFFLCELLNVINVVGQMFLTNRFLGGEFLRYGIEVIDFLDQDPELRIDPMARVFPRITKCVFHKYGPSGTIQKNDAMCILALNIMNEKIYTFLWFWFIILAIISGLDLLWRCTVVATPTLRHWLIRSRLSRPQQLDGAADLVVQRSSVGDWLLLDFLARNMDTIGFSAVVARLSKELSYGRGGGPMSSSSSSSSSPAPPLHETTPMM